MVVAPLPADRESPQFKYWEECLAQSFEEHGVSITPEQLAAVTRDVEGGHECYGQAFHTPEHPAVEELSRVRAELKAERELVHCETCNGRGRITTQGPYHSSNSECWRCRGNGKHKP